MTRDQLKKIIKECLVEILLDGAAPQVNERLNRAPLTKASPTPATGRRLSSQDNVRYAPQVSRKQEIVETVKTVTRDPTLAAILADTAMTTLVQQENAHPVGPGGDRATRAAAMVDPSELVAGITGRSSEEMHARWAQAAFAPTHHLPGMSRIDYNPYDDGK